VKPVLLDTGVIVGLLDRSERLHDACAETVRELEAPLITCEAVIAESCYLLRKLAGAAEAVIDNVAAGIFQIPFQLSQEAAGVKQILRKYRDRQIDLADACLIRLADEFGTADILTLDRDFAVYRWGRNKAFRMLPGV
jgi:predicted nucleic acid-binding protein